jgi:GT2 family glycosyltransferase
MNLGFGTASNIGAHHARGDVLLLLNNDTIIREEIFDRLEAYCTKHPECGAVGLGLENADGTLQGSLGRFPSIRQEWLMRKHGPTHASSVQTSIEWATGAALAVSRQLFNQIGGFDEGYFMYYEDIDLCQRIHAAGFAIHYLPEVRVVHLGGGSQPDGISPYIELEYRRSQMRYYSKHNSLLQRMLLRGYLLQKYGARTFSASKEKRATALNVLALITKGLHAHRN